MKYKLLFIAPGISNNDVGEVFMAYKWLEHLCHHFDITLLTLERKNKPTIYDGELPIKIVRFLELGPFHRFERFNSILKPWYIQFYLQARSWIANNAKSQQDFDWIHQITPMAARYPSPASSASIPYSLGPLAGGLETPEVFLNEIGSMPWYTRLRGLDKLRYRLDPNLKRTYKRASLIFAAADYIKARLVNNFGLTESDIIVENELGVDRVSNEAKEYDSSTTLRLLFVGRIVRTKGLRDVIRALQYLKSENIHLDVIGDGNDLAPCKAEVNHLGLSNIVTFHGKQPKPVVDTWYKQAHLMVFPSFREPTGGVVVEALSHGLPQIVSNYGGPASIVNEFTARMVPLAEPHEYAKKIGEAIREFLNNPELIKSMSSHALADCRQQYMWQNKLEKVAGQIETRIEKYRAST